MAKNILILFASLKEANALLFQSNIHFEKLSAEEYIYKNKNNVKVIITGIGNNSNKNISRIILANNTLIIKAGTCAVLDPNEDILIPVIPKYVSNEEETIETYSDNLPNKVLKVIKKYLSHKKLLSLNRALENPNDAKKYFKAGYAFIDMETYHMKKYFNNNIFIPILIGTDRGFANVKNDFLNNLNNASLKLKNIIEKIIRSV